MRMSDWSSDVCSSDLTTSAAADVVDVGEGGIEHALVFVPQRQAPGAVEDVLAGGQKFVAEVIVLGHQARGVAAERDHAGAGARGDVDGRLRLEIGRASCRERVCQYV